jgi:hypothetical protein
LASEDATRWCSQFWFRPPAIDPPPATIDDVAL